MQSTVFPIKKREVKETLSDQVNNEHLKTRSDEAQKVLTTDQSPPWQTDSHRIRLCYLNVHFRAYKCPSLSPLLSQMNPVTSAH